MAESPEPTLAPTDDISTSSWETIDEEEDLSSHFGPIDEPAMADSAEPAQAPTPDVTTPPETSTFLRMDVLYTKGIYAWLRSILGTDEEIQCEKSIVQLQAAVRGWIARRHFTALMKATIKLQAVVRGWIARRHFTARRKATMKLQAAVRGWIARRDFRTFMTVRNPPLSVIRKFCRLLKSNDTTLMQPTFLRAAVAAKLEVAQEQREEINNMERDITALVEGNADLRDLKNKFRKLKRRNRGKIEKAIRMKTQCRLRRKRELLDSYERLFCHLQTQPAYLSRLIRSMTSEKDTMKIMDRLLFNLFNHASTPREEYHLLKLMEDALRMEVRTKLTQSGPYGEFLVLKMIIRFYQQDAKYESVIQALKPAIQKILDVTTPLATAEQSQLLAITVLDTLFSSVSSIPYGMRYMARVLQQSIRESMPRVSKEGLLRTVGEFLHSYLKPAIEDPDVLGLDVQSGSVQKENLMAVSNLIRETFHPLYFVSAYVPKMRGYVTRTAPRFRTFYRDVMDLLDAEDEFAIKSLFDATSMEKSTISMTAEDIGYTHTLLLMHQKVVFPEETDVVYQMFKSIGPVPELKELLGIDAAACDEAETRASFSFQLSSKFHLQEVCANEMENLQAATKSLILDVIRLQPGDTLHEVLTTPASLAQEEEHKAYMLRGSAFDYTDSLRAKKMKIQTNLRILQEHGIVEDGEDCQGILNNIAKEIKMQHRLRQQRRAEEEQLKEASQHLDVLSNDLQNHIYLRKMYRERCVTNFLCPNIHGEIQIPHAGGEVKEIRYTAQELVRRGVIVKTCGKQRDLKREVLTIISEDGNIQVQLGKTGVLLPLPDLLILHQREPTMKLFHYDVDVGLLLFLTFSKLSSM